MCMCGNRGGWRRAGSGAGRIEALHHRRITQDRRVRCNTALNCVRIETLGTESELVQRACCGRGELVSVTS